MGLITKLFKNTGYLAIGNQVGNLLQFLFFLYFARQFGETVVGQYSFAFSFTYVTFLVLADLGLSAYLIREVARDKSGNRRIFSRCLSLRLLFLSVFSILTIAVVFIFFNNFSRDTIKIILLLGLYHIFFSIADIFLAEFLGHDRMGRVALLNMFVKLIITGVGISLIFMKFNFLTVLISFPIGSFIYLMACIYISSRYFKKVKPKFKDLNLGDLIKPVFPFAFTIIFINMFYHLDILMLRFLRDDQSVGIYSVANKIILAILGVMVFVHTALLPTFSRLYVDSKTELIELSKRIQRYLLLIGLPISFGLFGIADKLIIFLYSDVYKFSIDALKILSWTIALGFLAATYSVLLTAINRQTQKVIVVGICLAFNFIFNLILIPKLDYNGAAVAKLMSEVLHLAVMMYLIAKYLGILSFHKVLVKAMISCLSMYAFIQFFSQKGLIFIIPIAIVIYVFSFGVLRGYSHEEVDFIKRHFLKVFMRKKFLETYSSEK